MNDPIDITGAWRGFYEQDGGRHGISMDVVQRGVSFVGRMRDEDTLLSGTAEITRVDEDGAEIELPPIETMGVLPEFSIVEGTVTGEQVGFDKFYQGKHEVTVWGGGHGEAHHETSEHRVRYDGRLDGGARRIRGEWRIVSQGEDFEDEVGGFELARK